MTVGFDVFVHEVIAAIATEPEEILAVSEPIVTSIGSYHGSRATPPVTCLAGDDSVAASSRLYAGGSLAGNDSADASSTWPPTGRRRPTSPAATALMPFGKWLWKLSGSAWSGTRSCGRRGPATEGSTVARSSSSIASKSGPGPGSRHRPCSLA